MRRQVTQARPLATNVGALVTALSVGLFACEGSVVPSSPGGAQEPGRPAEGSVPAPPPPGGTAAPSVGSCQAPAGALRRVTRAEYENSVRELFGPKLLGSGWQLPAWFPEDERPENLYVGQGITTLWASKALLAAEEIAQRVSQDAASFVGFACGGAVADARAEGACVDRLLTTLGARAFRRPLRPEERDSARQIYDTVRAPGADGVTGDFREGLRALVQGLLSAPPFYYIEEADRPAASGVVTLTGHEMARRLASFLWRSLPDETLLAAAAKGELNTPDQIRAQARRMVAAPAARAALSDFFRQWWGLVDLATLKKDDASFTPAVRDSLARSLIASFENAAWQDRASFSALLTSRQMFVDANIAALFGARSTSQVLAPTSTNEPQRVGLLTHPLMQALLSKPDASDYIHRGKFIREQLLCQPLGAPPAAATGKVDEVLAKLGPDAPARAVAQAHASEPACQACHQLIDPLGLPFETFDHLGRHRTSVAGRAIDTSGALTGTDMDGPVTDAGDLSRKLASSRMVDACFAEKLLTHALSGVVDATSARCFAETLARPAPIADLLVEVAASPLFRTRTVARN